MATKKSKKSTNVFVSAISNFNEKTLLIVLLIVLLVSAGLVVSRGTFNFNKETAELPTPVTETRSEINPEQQ